MVIVQRLINVPDLQFMAQIVPHLRSLQRKKHTTSDRGSKFQRYSSLPLFINHC